MARGVWSGCAVAGRASPHIVGRPGRGSFTFTMRHPDRLRPLFKANDRICRIEGGYARPTLPLVVRLSCSWMTYLCFRSSPRIMRWSRPRGLVHCYQFGEVGQ
jgi:hypothetical protein